MAGLFRGKKKKNAGTQDDFGMDMEYGNPMDSVGDGLDSYGNGTGYDFGIDMNGSSFDPYSSQGDMEEDNPLPPRKGNSFLPILGFVATAVIIVVVGYLVFSLVTGPSKKQCRTMIKGFESACNDVDLSGMADYLEPSLSAKVKAGIAVADLFIDTDKILKMIGDGIGIGSLLTNSSADTTDVFKAIVIEPVKYGFPGKSRVVKCRISFLGIEQYVDVTIRKADGRCYIANCDIA